MSCPFLPAPSAGPHGRGVSSAAVCRTAYQVGVSGCPWCEPDHIHCKNFRADVPTRGGLSSTVFYMLAHSERASTPMRRTGAHIRFGCAARCPSSTRVTPWQRRCGSGRPVSGVSSARQRAASSIIAKGGGSMQAKRRLIALVAASLMWPCVGGAEPLHPRGHVRARHYYSGGAAAAGWPQRPFHSRFGIRGPVHEWWLPSRLCRGSGSGEFSNR
jgi:hypothetical protein